MAVSPEPKLTIARSAPQGRFRKQVERGSLSELLAETNGPHTTSELFLFLRSLLAFGFWLLAFGFWLLAFGFWLLAFGFWLLAFGQTCFSSSLATHLQTPKHYLHLTWLRCLVRLLHRFLECVDPTAASRGTPRGARSGTSTPPRRSCRSGDWHGRVRSLRATIL